MNMRISPVSNVSFSRLHIVKSASSKRAFKEIFESKEREKTVKETLDEIDYSTGNVDVYLKARPFLTNDGNSMQASWQFKLADSEGKSYISAEIPKSYSNEHFASAFEYLKNVKHNIPTFARINAEVEALHDKYQ